MAKLRLTNPRAVKSPRTVGELVEVDIAVDAPVPHLDGEYTYLAPKDSLSLGSLVKVPFGAGETFGFVTRIGSSERLDRKLKTISKILIAEQLFDSLALARFRRIIEQYGGSLISILKLAIPMRRSLGSQFSRSIQASQEIAPSLPDQRYLHRCFGFWEMNQNRNLLLAPGILWDHVAISIFMSSPNQTAIMVPTERDLQYLEESLRERGITQFHVVSSGLPVAERSREFLGILKSNYPLVIGTRSIAYLPTSFERVIIVDPGHASYQERRSPYFRSDDPSLWEATVITISHTRELRTIASGERYEKALNRGKHDFRPTSPASLISDLQRILGSPTGSRSILVSLNDRSFASGLLCGQCGNRTSCECGFPLSIEERGSSPSCSKCGKVHSDYRCRYCQAKNLRAIRAGNKGWALSIARSIRGARVILSDSSTEKPEVQIGESGLTVVIATQGNEPRIVDQQGTYLGYHVIALMGGQSGFNSSTLSKADQYRRAWARILGLAHPKRSHVLLDLDRSHVEYVELSQSMRSGGIENLLQERKSLSLPPYSILVQVFGEEGSLIRLKSALAADDLFAKPGSALYPVQSGSFVIKVSTQDRNELLQLLQDVVKMRSAKRLSPIRFHVAPEYL